MSVNLTAELDVETLDTCVKLLVSLKSGKPRWRSQEVGFEVTPRIVKKI